MEAHTKASLIQVLKDVGVRSGDLLFVHSDLRAFRLEDNLSREGILDFFKGVLLDAIGPDGTLAVPAYFYEYARFGEPFDPYTSPVSAPLGVFSQFIASDKNCVRSLNPLQSIAAIGKLKQDLCCGDSIYGYGVLSPWQRLLDFKGKILFLGAPVQAMTFVHHIEQVVGVPHLYNKIYSFPLKGNKQGHPISAVRYLNYGINYDLDRFKSDLTASGALKGNKVILVVDAIAAFDQGVKGLKEDPYYFLKSPPTFKPGEIPIDGMTGRIK